MEYEADIYDYKNCDDSFLVCLIETPKFPDGYEMHDGFHNLAVAAAYIDDGKLKWTTLNEDEKNCVGDAMIDSNCDFGTWYWCDLFEKED